MYLHERSHWMEFSWDEVEVLSHLASVRLLQGRLQGLLEHLAPSLSGQIELEALSSEVVASSQIEGVTLDRLKVRSSVSKQLGLPALAEGEDVDTASVDNAVSVIVDAVKNCNAPITQVRLFGWHNALFPHGYSGLRKIRVASYRSDPVRVVSGPIGHEKIHFEGIDASLVESAMNDFLNWVNEAEEIPIYKAAVAHLWFLTIHPFDDGNGRIARAITELLLAKADQRTDRYYAMANYILHHRDSYYEAIEKAQKGTPDITEWMLWFLQALEGSLQEALEKANQAIERELFWSKLDTISLNERQRKMLHRLKGDFEGKLTAAKWAKMCKVSPDTALRDINDLIKKQVLQKEPSGGRSTSYRLVE